ncbi:hypothetical protein Vadar_026482 [Vaccinium darrowii]|uniref:Uncharacterized protein n=1 Tax=Vaccinium darrowii TaxID=229202 RepID=A0ACB7YZ64_9ERIC|nr:hypothetical protein Vadar_026482 [Vaccinium darrowii]
MAQYGAFRTIPGHAEDAGKGWTLASRLRANARTFSLAEAYRLSKGRNVVTIYVDDLLEDMYAAWLGQIFSKYGCVLDAFIPKKRSRGFNSKFGFVRFGSLREAEEAISSMNGMIIRDKEMLAKVATFSSAKDYGENEKKEVFRKTDKDKEEKRGFLKPEPFFHNGQGMSYVEAVSGSKSNGLRRISIEANPIEWLCRSAVAKLRSLSAMEVIREALHREGAPQTENYLLLEGETVWISCYGVPLHGWSVATFRKIAQLWGEVLSVDDATVKGTSFAVGKILIAANSWDKINESICLELNGRSFEVIVVEEQVHVQGHSDNPNATESVEKPYSPVDPVENSVVERVLNNDLVRVNTLIVEPASSCSQLSLGCSKVDETALEVGDRGLNNLNSVPGCLACVENAGDKVECGDKVGLDVDHEFFNWAEVIHKEVGPVGVNNLGLYSISEDGPGDNIINAVGHTPVMEKPIDIISGADSISENHQVEEVNITALPIGNCTLALEDGRTINAWTSHSEEHQRGSFDGARRCPSLLGLERVLKFSGIKRIDPEGLGRAAHVLLKYNPSYRGGVRIGEASTSARNLRRGRGRIGTKSFADSSGSTFYARDRSH